MAGDNISYGIGKWAGERTVKRLFRSEKAHRGFDWAERQLEERGSYIILVGRFIPFGRTAVTFTSGYTKGLPWHRFFRYDLVAGGIWATYATMLGYIGGKQFEEQPWKGVLVGLGIAFSVAFVIELVRKWREKKAPPGAVRSGSRVRIHVTGASGFLGSELLALEPGATGERVEIRDARRRAGPVRAPAARGGRPHRLSPGWRRRP